MQFQKISGLSVVWLYQMLAFKTPDVECVPHLILMFTYCSEAAFELIPWFLNRLYKPLCRSVLTDFLWLLSGDRDIFC